VERFIDTPVKHYSSGMYVRLAFAVAAHLEPEILLVDEVLAVGDAQFQKKCLGRMGAVAREGRTILLVSHNMGAINRLCSKCLWIEGGGVKAHEIASAVVTSYLSEGVEAAAERHWDGKDAPGGDGVCLRSARICQPTGRTCAAIDIQNAFDIEVEVEVETDAMEELGIGIQIVAADGQVVYHSTSLYSGHERVHSGLQRATCTLPAYTLNAGVYSLTVSADRPQRELVFLHENAVNWSVEATCPTMGRYTAEAWKGVLGPGLGKWSTTSAAAETKSWD
jgi:lipopolysaccharide transport system ATP-binding protein